MVDRSAPGGTVVDVDLALAGSGNISVIHGLAAAHTGSPIIAVASRTAEKARERAEQIGARVVPFAELPAGADAVVICTPPNHHTEIALQAIAGGAAVLIEKPLASTLADADAIVAAGGRTLYGENLAFSPVVRRTLDLTATIGELDYIEVRALSLRPTWGSFLEPSNGGGALFDLGPHPIALALLLARGEQPISVSATLERSPGIEVDDHAVVMLQFASGLSARIEVSWRETDVVWDIQASSPTGVVRTDLLPIASIEYNGEPVQLPSSGRDVDPRFDHLGFIDQMEALEAVTSGAITSIDASFGRRVLDVICGAYRSAGNDNGPVPLPFAGPRDRSPHSLWVDQGD